MIEKKYFFHFGILPAKLRLVNLAVIISVWLPFVSFAQSSKTNFYSYYTHIKTNEQFEKSSPTGEYADVIVNLHIGRLIFWRGTSYLPKWHTSKGDWMLQELVKREGDGNTTMPDKVNTFSHVSIISSNTDSTIIHWRYLPSFKLTSYPFAHTGFDAFSFVDEYFTVYPSGQLKRVIIKGTKRIDDYASPNNVQTQQINLRSDGIFYKSMIAGKESFPKTKEIIKRVLSKSRSSKLLAAFSFNENEGDYTSESVSGMSYEVMGSKTLWKKGVLGSCLDFDGYQSVVNTSPTLVNTSSLTLSSWICIGAYPWNWVPIVQSGDKQGFFLGINAYGNPAFRLLTKDSVFELVGKIHLDTYKWYQITASYSLDKGWMYLYINGKSSDSLHIDNFQPITFGEQGLQLGRSTVAIKPTDAVRPERTYKSRFGFDGLIDELKIYTNCQDAEQVQQDYQQSLSKSRSFAHADLEKRHFPVIPQSNHFRAYYTHLKYYDTWDNLWRFGPYPDVVVEFANNPSKFIFWRGTSYIPQLVNDKNQWFTNEFNETWNKSGGEGCMEPMSDKENYTSHVRIVEQSPARVIINWRVALMDVNHHIYANFDSIAGWGDWMDWYYYIYPDGVAVKKMRLFTHGELNHEWQESIVLMGENQKPEDVLESSPVFTSIDTAGKETLYDWVTKPPATVNFKDALVHKTNLKSDWDVFTIQRFTGGDVYNSELTPYSIFCTWNHWPTAQIVSDGRNASFNDRASHSSTTHLKWAFYKTEKGARPYAEKLLMEGLSNKSSVELYSLALSWLQPAPIIPIAGIQHAYYDSTQRAFQIFSKETTCSFSLLPTPKNPVVNPAFVIHGWDDNHIAQVYLGEQHLVNGKDVEQGVIIDPEGKLTLVVWVKMSSTTSPLDFRIEK